MIWIDRITTWGITFGGMAVILAVVAIFVYLVLVARPLFGSASLTGRTTYQLLDNREAGDVAVIELDEYRSAGFCLLRNGELLVFDAGDGTILDRRRLFPESPALTAWSRPLIGDRIALAFEDGTIRTGSIGFETTFVPAGEEPSGTTSLAIGERARSGDSILEMTSTGALRRVRVNAAIEEPLSVPDAGTRAVRLDFRTGSGSSRLAVLDREGGLHVDEILSRTNFMTGEQTIETNVVSVPMPAGTIAPGEPRGLLVSTAGDQLYVTWPDGTTLRYDLAAPGGPLLAEKTDLVSDPEAELTEMRFMPGEQSILVCDSLGGVRVWFRVSRPGINPDDLALVVAHTLDPPALGAGAGIESVALSTRDKSFATGSNDGRIRLLHMTSEKELADLRIEAESGVLALQISPKGNGLLALDERGRVTQWDLSSPHAEVSVHALFGRVWYEGYPGPGYTWQSSSGTDDFEPKLSLVPLVFGTLKATFYSMLFAVPIALLGAIYTSEFLDPSYRAPLKSAVEMMASLPSVVLGFLAALVLAPVVENWVIAVLAAFCLIPLTALGFGYAWQLVPGPIARRVSGRSRLLILLGLILLSVWLGIRSASLLERLLFLGDFKAWLDGRIGTGTPGTAVMVWPVTLLGLLLADRHLLDDILGRRLRFTGRQAGPALDLARYLSIVALSLAISWLLALAATSAGFDPRGLLFGTYVQRNALVVGFVMGFAVIPIIFTIADDALTAVPRTLRSASLGCGATRWQTATRVVLPVAIPGIFSALMVGLGRAVGETMIVVMAAGNTPLMDLNVFNGLRTLSATIAVELPEAVRNGTLYRTLFVAALTLFVLTFVVNTVAEYIRLRFRRRAVQL